MRFLTRWTACLTFLQAAFGCTCGPLSWAPACQLVSLAPVVFLGTVRSVEQDPASGDPSAAVYRFSVERRYRGLPADMDTVTVDPDNHTSCQTRYLPGKQYLLFAEPWRNGPTGPEVLISGGCSGSRLVTTARDDLVFLEAYVRGRTRARVFGKTLQWVNSFRRAQAEEQSPLAGARITLQSVRETRVQVSAADGAYAFEDVPPGVYRLTAQRSSFVAAREPHTITVAPGGCVEQLLELHTRNELAGVVVDHRGNPRPGTSVQLLHRNPAGTWFGTGKMVGYSDRGGRFRFENLPAGDYLLGCEIWGDQPDWSSPLPTVYYPGVALRAQGAVIPLGPEERVTELTLRLPKPHTPRTITVTVVWPDGWAPGNHLLQVSANGQLIKNTGGRLPGRRASPRQAENVVTFEGYQEREYRISARYWVDDLGGPVPHHRQRVAEAEEVAVPRGAGRVAVRLVLGRPRLADQ